MSSFWDDFKELFKTKSQKAEEKQNKIDEALNKEDELTAKLDELDKKYIDSLPKDKEIDLEKLFPTDSGYKEVKYSPSTDEEIEDIANKDTAYNKQLESNNLNNKFSSSLSKLDESKDTAQESLQESYKKLESVYTDLKRQAENNSIKRGMARSSVILGQLDNLNAAQLASVGEIEAAYNDTIDNINTQIGELEAERDNALYELDLKYASELANRIADLKDERASTVAQYEKYNNSVRDKQTKYQQQREEKIADYLKKKESDKLASDEAQREYESKYGYSGDKLKNYSQRYDLAFDFYSSLSSDIAADALIASPNMKYYLGNYYNKLLSVLKNRADTTNTKKYY